MKRHHVILGTPTSAGGQVVSASSLRSLDGINFALEGDEVSCLACRSTGFIRCQGPRLIDTWNGTHFALEHDLCICRCETPPTLLAAQSFSFQTVQDDEFFAAIGDGEEVIWQQFELRGRDGLPLQNFCYSLHRSGKLHVARGLFSEGKTVMVEGDEPLELALSLDQDPGAKS